MIENGTFTAEQFFYEDGMDGFGEKCKVESTFSKKTNNGKI